MSPQSIHHSGKFSVSFLFLPKFFLSSLVLIPTPACYCDGTSHPSATSTWHSLSSFHSILLIHRLDSAPDCCPCPARFGSRSCSSLHPPTRTSLLLYLPTDFCPCSQLYPSYAPAIRSTCPSDSAPACDYTDKYGLACPVQPILFITALSLFDPPSPPCSGNNIIT